MELPSAFKKRIAKNWEPKDYQSFMDSFKNTTNSIRLNPLKNPETIQEISAKIPWCQNGFYLNTRPSYTWDANFQAGKYYVQEAGSMFLEQIVAQWKKHRSEEKIVALDACAAPGGKSTHLLSLLNPITDVLVTNEPIAKRNKTLQENIGKWGYSNALISKENMEKTAVFPNEFFDIIMVDAPCSGEGMFRKDERAITEWSEENVEKCALRQNLILENLIPSLKPNGLLIYATCTFNEQENENQSSFIVSAGLQHLEVEIPQNTHIKRGKNQLGVQFIPGITSSEGLYMAGFIKSEDAAPKTFRKKIRERLKTIQNIPSELKKEKHICHFLHADSIHFCTKEAAHIFNILPQIHFTKVGLEAGITKNEKFTPHSELAFSVAGNHFPKMEIGEEDFHKFLRGESWKNSENALGIHETTFNNTSVGFAKGVKGRWNNLREKHLRVLQAAPKSSC